METKQSLSTDKSPVIALTRTGVVIWIVSLLLPGFVIENVDGVWYGFNILWAGLLFGWSVNGWAAYANLLFFYVIRRLFNGQNAYKSAVFMFLLAATLPIFRGVIHDEGSMGVDPVASWGWGAILWLISLAIVLCAATIQAFPGITKICLTVLSVGSLCALIPTTIIHYLQWQKANIQERQTFLPTGTAFTREPLCGIAVNWPDESLIPEGEIVSLDIDPELKSASHDKPFLWLPNFLYYQEGNFDWRVFGNPINPTIRVRSPAQLHRFVIQARRSSSGGAYLQLLDRQSNTMLYEQRLVVIQTVRGNSMFCPYSSISNWMQKGYDQALLHAVGQDKQTLSPVRIKSELVRNPCSVSQRLKDDNWTNLYEWDGRVVGISASYATYAGFCSDNYAVLVSVSDSPPSPGDHYLSSHMQVFERITLKPVAMFSDGRPSGRPGSRILENDLIEGVRIEGTKAIIETAFGESTVTLIVPPTK